MNNKASSRLTGFSVSWEHLTLTYIFTTLFENLASQVTVLFTCFTLLTVALQCELFQNYGKLFNSTLRKQAKSCKLKLNTDQDTLESLSNLEKKAFYFNLDARFHLRLLPKWYEFVTSMKSYQLGMNPYQFGMISYQYKLYQAWPQIGPKNLRIKINYYSSLEI